MASMSYCAFENTAIDMKQCVGIMADAVDEGTGLGEFLKELSSSDERRAVKQLVQHARDLIELYEQLENYETQDEEEEEAA
jgi:hypothetical protein